MDLLQYCYVSIFTFPCEYLAMEQTQTERKRFTFSFIPHMGICNR